MLPTVIVDGQTLYQDVLPGGRAVRYAEIDVQAMEDLAAVASRRASPTPGSTFDVGEYNKVRRQQLIVRGLRAVTSAPVAIVRSKITLPAVDGQPEQAIDGDIDTAATHAQIPETAWIPLTYQDLVGSGERNVFKVLRRHPEYHHAAMAIGRIVDAIDDTDGPLSKAHPPR